jgi:hypothetical protein
VQELSSPSSIETSGFGIHQKTQFRYHGRGRGIILPAIMLSISIWGGKGIFTLTDIPAFTFISEYAGEIVDDTDGKVMMQAGKDTHLLSLSSKFNAGGGRFCSWTVHGGRMNIPTTGNKTRSPIPPRITRNEFF